MIRPQDVRKANKQNVDWGKWESGRMPRSAFQLSRRPGRSYRLGSSYRWRIVSFEALGKAFRLLIAFNPQKEQYRATLALDKGRDMSVLVSYEFHGTHPGWHVSAACGDVEHVPAGMMRGPWQRRFPGARARHRNTEFGLSNEDAALDAADRFFHLHKAEGVML